MTIALPRPLHAPLNIRWEPLPDDFVLPDDPVESTLQPLLAAALREALELADRIPAHCLIASNFGLCAVVDGKTIVKAPDWVYVPRVQSVAVGAVRRSYTPNLEGEKPAIVMEFISATEGGEYSIKPSYPYGKWFFYEQILQVPIYVIFEPDICYLEVYQLQEGQYKALQPDTDGRYWLGEIGLFLGVWQGQKAEVTAPWLRWWDESGRLLLWGSERIAEERLRAEQAEGEALQERLRAEQAEGEALQERLRAERSEAQFQALQERLRSLGVDLGPD
ncbi:MAG: Uma2 family endonuclease [Prochlorothrix sp.]|nr:Uma2 family endonuclease [Prochlorothrix sp.]